MNNVVLFYYSQRYGLNIVKRMINVNTKTFSYYFWSVLNGVLKIKTPE